MTIASVLECMQRKPKFYSQLSPGGESFKNNSKHDWCRAYQANRFRNCSTL